MKKNLLMTGICMLMLVAVSCKKSNLTKDQWIITKATDLEDGSDITSDYTGEIWEFDKDGTYSENGVLKGTWVFSDKKEDLVITKTNGNVDSYLIKELKKKTMILEELGDEELELSKY